MGKVFKLVLVLLVLVGGVVGALYGSAAMDDNRLKGEIHFMLGPDTPPAVVERKTREKMAEMGVTPTGSGVELIYSSPQQSHGPVASKVGGTLKVYQVNAEARVTYERKILGILTKQTQLVVTKSYPSHALPPTRHGSR
jgi:hypothetical protein